ncbi:MAG: type IV secretion protein Rhs, partial [Anaerolineae bacterium]|nr:type IV secretion protein Rhs [Anaerolineae bacterium]
DDEVLVAFEGGDPRRPYVVGALWNGQDTPPETMDGAGNNFIKSITSRNGVKITLDDNDGQEKMILETPGGQKLTLQDGPGKVEIVDSNGNSVTLDSGGISVVASVKVSVRASTVEVNASMVTVNAAMSKFSGVVQCDTLISNSVISAT